MLIDTRLTAEQPPAELIDFTTGEVLERGDADALISAFERVKAEADKLYSLRHRIAEAIVALSEGPNKTRRVRGKARIAKIEMPDEGWTQSILKEAWNAYPTLRDEFLRIESVGVKLREWKKLKETVGPADLEQFKKMLASANVGTVGTARVSVEK